MSFSCTRLSNALPFNSILLGISSLENVMSEVQTKHRGCLRHIVGRQIAVRAEDSDDDDDAERTYAFPPPVDLDAYAEACRLPPAEETEDEREARFQRERFFGL